MFESLYKRGWWLLRTIIYGLVSHLQGPMPGRFGALVEVEREALESQGGLGNLKTIGTVAMSQKGYAETNIDRLLRACGGAEAELVVNWFE